jgi:threonine dehydrogenase-like Zn-dependent dehydrogenase
LGTNRPELSKRSARKLKILKKVIAYSFTTTFPVWFASTAAGKLYHVRKLPKTHVNPAVFRNILSLPANMLPRYPAAPGECQFEAGTLVEPLACVIHAIRKAGIKAGDSVALIGTGAMGLMFIQCLL